MTETVDDAVARLGVCAEMQGVTRRALELFGHSSVDVYNRDGALIIVTPLDVEINMCYSTYFGEIRIICHKANDTTTARFLGVRRGHYGVRVVCNWLATVARYIERRGRKA